MFEKVLIVAQVPFSEIQLVKKAKHLKDIGVKECVLAQCIASMEEVSAMSVQFSEYLNENMEKQVQILKDEGLEVESLKIIDTDILTQIDIVAREAGCKAIVVGEQRQNLIGEFMLGGVAYEVIHKAKLPVIVFKTSDSTPLMRKMNSHVLFPTDFSDNAALAYEKLKELAVVGIDKVTLVTVIKKTWLEPYLNRDIGEFKTSAMEKLDAMKDELIELRVPEVDTLVLHGNPAQELLHLIDDKEISLVVMGSQGSGFIKEVSLGSLSHNMVRHADAPVLLVPAKRD